MKTEFEAEFFLYNEMDLNHAVSSFKKNGKPIFDINVFKNNLLWTIIKIEKNESNFEVTLQNDSFFSESSCLMKTISYIGQYASLGEIPTEVVTTQRPCMEFYFSSDGYDVRAERIRNYGFTSQDLTNAIPALCEKIKCNDSFINHWTLIPMI